MLLDTDGDTAARLGCERYRPAGGKLWSDTSPNVVAAAPQPLPAPATLASGRARLLEVTGLAFADIPARRRYGAA